MEQIYLFKGFYPNDGGDETIFIDGQEYKGIWVYGSLLNLPNGECEIAYTNPYDHLSKIYSVIPSTVSQYIGKDDINGKKIFTGDIDSSGSVITYNTNSACFGFMYRGRFFTMESYANKNIEMVGNRWNNPDLAESGADSE